VKTTQIIEPNAWREKAPWVSLVPRVISRPGCRDPRQYIEVAKSFDVLDNPRYRSNETRYGLPPGTYCNIYVWDVTSAMQSEAPHWIDVFKRPAGVAAPGTTETTANGLIDWFHEGRCGWRKMDDAREAYAIADTGRPVVACWRSPPGRVGHVAMVMPGNVIAQAGANNLWLEPIAHGFGGLVPEFFGHE
jgi:hypothetical protein